MKVSNKLLKQIIAEELSQQMEENFLQKVGQTVKSKFGVGDESLLTPKIKGIINEFDQILGSSIIQSNYVGDDFHQDFGLLLDPQKIINMGATKIQQIFGQGSDVERLLTELADLSKKVQQLQSNDQKVQSLKRIISNLYGDQGFAKIATEINQYLTQRTEPINNIAGNILEKSNIYKYKNKDLQESLNRINKLAGIKNK
jgi:hypothetical protein